jgi:hypothetical protein
MNQSEEIKDLAEALAKAQGQIKGALKDSANPFFAKSGGGGKYADLASVWEACRKPLSDNGLSVLQAPCRLLPLVVEGGTYWMVELETVLMHSSGQWMGQVSSTAIEHPDAQKVGSADTYLRRYSLASFAGVAPEDDDGNAASGKHEGKVEKEKPKAPAGYAEWLNDIKATADEGMVALKAAWLGSLQANRDYLTSTAPKEWEATKLKAEKADKAREVKS